jgi:hypothetical protein
MKALIEFSESGRITHILLCGKSSDENQAMYRSIRRLIIPNTWAWMRRLFTAPFNGGRL